MPLRAHLFACGLGIALLGCVRVAHADTLVYDGMSGNPTTGNVQMPNAGGVPAGSGNRQMGLPTILADPAALVLTGFDFTWGNATGAAITLDSTHRLRLNFWVWNSVTFGDSGTMAFSNAAGSGQVLFAPATPLTIANNQFIQFAGGAAVSGSFNAPANVPGISMTPHITVTSTGPIGIAFNWELDNGTGAFAQMLGSTSMVVGGSSAAAPAVGANAFPSPNFGYFRSPNWATVDSNGNFDAASGRQVGANSGLALRVYAVGATPNICCADLTGACIAASDMSCPAGSTFRPGVSCSPNPCMPASHTVGVVLAGSGGGTVVSIPPGVDCPGACIAQFAHGTNLRLVATANARSVFMGWSGPCTGAGLCDATLTGPLTIQAEFRCLADFNGVGDLSVADIFDFLSAWFAQDPRADFNGANGINITDIFSFLDAWFAGCG